MVRLRGAERAESNYWLQCVHVDAGGQLGDGPDTAGRRALLKRMSAESAVLQTFQLA